MLEALRLTTQRGASNGLILLVQSATVSAAHDSGLLDLTLRAISAAPINGETLHYTVNATIYTYVDPHSYIICSRADGTAIYDRALSLADCINLFGWYMRNAQLQQPDQPDQPNS